MRNLHIRWQGHASALSSSLKKLFYEHIFTDVSVACEGKLYPAHRFILSACSDYFEEIFACTHGSNIVVVLKDMSKKNFEYLLEYMYMGEVDLSDEDLVNFLKSSEFLKLKGLPSEQEEEREAQTHSKRLSSDAEKINASSVSKRRKLFKGKQRSIEIIADAGSSRRSSHGADHSCPSPGISVQTEAAYYLSASPVQTSVQIAEPHGIISQEVASFPGNVTTTMISAAAQPEVIPCNPSPASKRPPLVTIPTTPTFMHFSSPPESPTLIKEEVDPQCFLEVCTEEIEHMDQLDFDIENWSSDLYFPPLDRPEKDQLISRRSSGDQVDIIENQPSSRTSEETTKTKTSRKGSIMVSDPLARTSEETAENRTSKEATESKASKVSPRKDKTSKKSASKKKLNKSTVANTTASNTMNLIRPCHVQLEQLVVVEENGVLSWRNPSQTSFKSSSNSTRSRPQRGKENSMQERSGAALKKRTLGTSEAACDITECSKEVTIIRTRTESGEEMRCISADAVVQQGLNSHVRSMDERSVGAGISNVLVGIGNKLSDTACIENTISPSLEALPCSFCNLTFLDENTRDMHQFMHQSDHINSVCLYCNQAFEAISMQTNHMLQHDGHVAPLHAYLKKTGRRLKWYFVFLHMGHPCVQLKPEWRPVVIRTRLELQKLLSMLRKVKSKISQS